MIVIIIIIIIIIAIIIMIIIYLAVIINRSNLYLVGCFGSKSHSQAIGCHRKQTDDIYK